MSSILDSRSGRTNQIVNWFKFSSPATFYPLAGKLIPFFWVLAIIFGIAGLWISFFVAPVDAVQGQGYRIIFVHVPASWMSMFIYIMMAVWAGLDGIGVGANRCRPAGAGLGHRIVPAGILLGGQPDDGQRPAAAVAGDRCSESGGGPLW